MAYRAGAHVGDLEFVQFHPTALNVPGQPRFLLSEALRGEGAHLVNHRGDRFMARYDPAGEMAPRDRVARAIARESEATGHPVCLRLSHMDQAFVHARFPLISAACRDAGLDLARDPIPVGPAAHYVMGGVLTDLDGRTTLPGLYAAGEVACTGVHGANRLASNSLLEGLVFGARAGAAMKNDRVQGSGFEVQGSLGGSEGSGGAARELTAPEIQALMWRHVGLFRSRDGLQQALDLLNAAWRHLNARLERGEELSAEEWRTASLLTVGRLVARAALRREESRGAHYRTDCPQRDDIHWKLRLSDVIDRDGIRKK
jgi:L-aspartate oxidase